MTTNDEPVRVTTTEGVVVGRREGDYGLAVFRGIPYAAPPIGRRRFRPPARPSAWIGERDATAFGPKSVQPPPDAAGAVPGDPDEQSEDCLYLNIWTPAAGLRCPTNAAADAPVDAALLPVMVWIHGGGYVSGAASSALYAGEHLAARGVVVVSLNYRLGALGWLAHPALAEADPSTGEVRADEVPSGKDPSPGGGFGNWGLLDQLAALDWVADNIAGFGGDPANVTVFGESAGAFSLAGLLATPAAGRRFQRAILQSGGAYAHAEGAASVIAEELTRELGLDRVSREGLLAVPDGEILRAQIAVARRYEGNGLPFQPVVDGGILAVHPAEAIAAGSACKVDLIVGTNRDEWRFWTWSNPSLRDIDDEQLVPLVARLVDGSADPAEMVETYRRARVARDAAVTPADLYSAIASDWTFRVPSMRLAEASGSPNVFTYLFDWESPFADGALGACHALELPFVFGSYANRFVALFSGSGEGAERLSEAMQLAWASFAATGDPSCEAAGEWPRYTASRRATKRFGQVVEVLEAPMEVERAWLDAALGQYGVAEAARSAGGRLPFFRHDLEREPG